MNKSIAVTKKTILLSFLLLTSFGKAIAAPKLTIIFIIDQFAHHYLKKVTPHMNGGIRFLLDNGTVYNNAHVPHAQPATSVGHVAINTGVYAKTHGIVGNKWFDKKGKKRYYESIDANPEHRVFSPTGLYPEVKSSGNIMADGISDQFVLESQPTSTYKVFALTHKSRAGIGLAGKLGKAIWFDQKGRQFTSSKAYFDKLPTWLTEFNKKYFAPATPKKLVWKPFHVNKPSAYNFYQIKNYKYASHPFSIINKSFRYFQNGTANEYGEIYIKTPHANQHLLDMAKECLEANLSKNKDDRLLIWISLSPLDPLGHFYGPDSFEVIDMIYHLDWQINHFMEYAKTKVDPKDILFGLTADHGVMPIIGILKEKGYKNIHRIHQIKLVKRLNQKISEKYGIDKLIHGYQSPQFYINQQIFNNLLSKEEQKRVIKTIKNTLLKTPGVAQVWTYDELKSETFEPGSINSFFKNQLYPGRSGQIICKCRPYCQITKNAAGAGHKTPYGYDTHVPLAFYQQGEIEKKEINDRVFSIQIANTLAKILQVNRPSASTIKPLPGI